MENLEKLFEAESQKNNLKVIQTMEKNKIVWEKYRKGAEEIYEKLEFLNNKGYGIELVNIDFDEKLFRDGCLPKVSFIKTAIQIQKSIGDEFIIVSSVGIFPLMGEKHTYESFIKKLLK